MTLRYYANAPATTLSASCSNSTTSIQIASATGLPIQYPYTLILDRGTASEEAVSVTNASGTTLTVTRAIDGTTAFAHSLGAVVEHGVTAQDIREPNAHINASTAVHGLAGAVVGTTDAQALTNKDLTGASNTFPTSLATLAGVQALTNKTLGTTNTINGFTASKFMEADGTGKLVSGTKAIPAGVVLGDTDAQTLTNKTLSTGTKVGAATTDISGAWTAWTPSFAGVLTPGNGVATGDYIQIGKFIIFTAKFVLGTTSTVSATAGSISCNLPAALKKPVVLTAQFLDSGLNIYSGQADMVELTSGATAVAIFGLGTAGSGTGIASGAPFTWSVNDTIHFAGTYEAV